MGLVIESFDNIKKSDAEENEDGEYVDPILGTILDDVVFLWVNPDFSERAEEIETGPYTVGKSFSFSAGSYSSYNNWRNELAKLAGWPEGEYKQYGRGWKSYAASVWNAKEGPFWELIYFSDCEGVIGFNVAAKLAKDFETFEDKAKNHPNERFRTIYENMHMAFALAANSGVVQFH